MAHIVLVFLVNNPMGIRAGKLDGLSHDFKMTSVLDNICLTDKPSLLDSLLKEVSRQGYPVERNL